MTTFILYLKFMCGCDFGHFQLLSVLIKHHIHDVPYSQSSHPASENFLLTK